MDPEDIEAREFATSLRGYDREEVDSFRRGVAAEVRRLRSALAQQVASASSAESPTPPDTADAYRQVGDETARILVAAEQAAREIKERGQREVAELLADAREEAAALGRAAIAERETIEEDIRQLQEARAMLGTEMEDLRRRFEELVLRLRQPFEIRRTRPKPADPKRPAPDAWAPDEPQAPPQGKAGPVEAPTSAATRPTVPAAGSTPSGPGPQTRPPVPAPDRAPSSPAPKATRPAPAAPPEPMSPAARFLGASAPRVIPFTEGEGGRGSATVPGAAPVEEAAPTAPAAAPAASTGQAQIAEAVDAVTVVTAPAASQADPGVASDAPAAHEAGTNGGAPQADVPAHLVPPRPRLPDLPAPGDGPGALAWRTAALGDLPGDAAKRLKRLLQDDQNELLERLRTWRGVGPAATHVASPDTHAERFTAGLRDVLEAAFSAGRHAGGSSDPGDPSTTIASLVTKQLVTPLRRDLMRLIEPPPGWDTSATAASKRASDVYRVWKGVRTDLLGEGLVYAVFHQGLLQAVSGNGSANKEWVVSADERNCPREVCRSNASAGPVGLDAPFPSGHVVPPAHGGCTCTLLLVRD
jgi:DivIVA domain-containing protein